MNSREKIKEVIKEALVQKGANFVALFGSFAREEEKPTLNYETPQADFSTTKQKNLELSRFLKQKFIFSFKQFLYPST